MKTTVFNAVEWKLQVDGRSREPSTLAIAGLGGLAMVELWPAATQGPGALEPNMSNPRPDWRAARFSPFRGGELGDGGRRQARRPPIEHFLISKAGNVVQNPRRHMPVRAVNYSQDLVYGAPEPSTMAIANLGAAGLIGFGLAQATRGDIVMESHPGIRLVGEAVKVVLFFGCERSGQAMHAGGLLVL